MYTSYIVVFCFSIFLKSCIANYNTIETGQTNNGKALNILVGDQYKQRVSENNRKLDNILNFMNQIKYDVNNMKVKVKSIDTKLFSSKKDECQKKDETKDYIVHNCGINTGKKNNHYVVDGDYGDFKIHGFCRVIIPKVVSGQNYKLTTRLYSSIGPQGVDSGFLGLAYNVQDEFNFDFIYIRLHLPNTCYRSGFIQNGKIVWVNRKTGRCPGGPPKGKQWFKLQVLVHDTVASFFINGIQIAMLSPHFPVHGQGGVIVATGHRNIIQFKHFNISTINRSNFKFSACKSHNRIGGNYHIMEGDFGEWPDAGFCRAISKVTLKKENYAISVSLYNQVNTRDRGTLGVAYNVKNNYNYDFVYFRTNSAGGCYTTGFVQNTQIEWINSIVGSCPGGPQRNGKWLNVTISVRGKRATIQLNSNHVVSLTTHFTPTGRGGVLVSNGQRTNIGAFRDFEIKAIKPHPFIFHECALRTKEISNYYILDAEHGKWPENAFCKAISKTISFSKFYFLAAELFIQSTFAGQGTDYAGMMFNVKNENNYDFVYFTPHDYQNCYKVGFVLNGEIQWSNIINGKCEFGRPKSGMWIQLEIRVNNNQAMISLEGRHLLTYKPYYPAFGRGGVIIGNGYRNVLSFREFLNYKIKPMAFIFHSCGEGTYATNGSVVLDASLPKTTPVTLCRALSRSSIQSTKNYTVQAKFFNIDSWQGGDWGNLGLIYNSKDEENFDFITINLKSKDECYEYGSMFNGIIRYNRDHSGRCKVKPPVKKWFKLILVAEESSNKVGVFLNNKNIAHIKSSLPYKPKGGVVVPNGNKNIVMFKDFQTTGVDI